MSEKELSHVELQEMFAKETIKSTVSTSLRQLLMSNKHLLKGPFLGNINMM